MSMTDPIADLLTRIRNALAAEKRWTDVPSSQMKKRVIYILKEESYIEDFIFIKDGEKETIRIFLKYDYQGKPVIDGIVRVSKPGCRIYVNSNHIPRVLDGLGIAILSTSRGVISNKTAKKLKIGGEHICNIW
jgi:small subunit ribosomal protein S8